MGNCIATSTTGKPTTTAEGATAKVVVHDGRVEEFSYPVKVSYLLQLYPACFICDSDEMGYDDVVTAVHQDHELRLGQLYFALPLSRLKRHLPPHEMAALAVTASAALSKCRKQILLLSADRRVAPQAADDDALTFPTKRKTAAPRAKGRGRGKFTATLSGIPEQGLRIPHNTLPASHPHRRGPPSPRVTLTARHPHPAPHPHHAPPSPRRPALAGSSLASTVATVAHPLPLHPPSPSPRRPTQKPISSRTHRHHLRPLRVSRQPLYRWLSTTPQPLPAQIF
ncbi:hypothetical protein Fmac_014867 [Flemingia macrophylla]|uniref:Uncharacterized protein n=1 Tax=Flemingia macrophylla TaxID=520843 RepID=A0ABD1MCZ4_9FABA